MKNKQLNTESKDKFRSRWYHFIQSLTSIISNASSAVSSPLIYLSLATDADSRQSKYSSKDIPFVGRICILVDCQV